MARADFTDDNDERIRRRNQRRAEKARAEAGDREPSDDNEPPVRKTPQTAADGSGVMPKKRVVVVEDEDDDGADDTSTPAQKKKSKKNKKKINKKAATDIITYALWGAGGLGVLLFGVIVYLLVGVAFKPADKVIDGIAWYKAGNTLTRFDMLFPGSAPTYDLIRLRNPDNGADFRGELWQRRYKGRMYEACYVSGDNLQGGGTHGAAMRMAEAPATDPKAAWITRKIVLDDGARCVVMRVYSREEFDPNDPFVLTFFESFTLP